MFFVLMPSRNNEEGKGRESGVIVHNVLRKFRLSYQWLDMVYGSLDMEGIDGSHSLARSFLV